MLPLLLALVVAWQESCPNCLHQGVLPCKEHDEVPIEEEIPSAECPLEYCSWAADCPKCGGTLWVDCPRCPSGERSLEVDERARLIAAWKASNPLEQALGRPVPRLETRRFSLVADVETLPGPGKGNKKKVSGHELAHQLAHDLEHVAAQVAGHYAMEEPDYRAKMRLWLWHDLRSHRQAQEKFQGTLTTGDFKLLGRDPVFSVWTEPSLFDTAPKVRALFSHNAAHMLLSNAFRPEWVGDIGGGWFDAGLGHWYEYELFGRTVNYCLEEAMLAENYENGQWRAAVRKRLEREKDPFLPGLLPQRTGAMSAAEHALCWSFYDFLVTAHPGVVRPILAELKQRKPAREILAQHLGADVFAIEDAWRAWVKEVYPTKGDAPRGPAAAKGKSRD